MAGTTKTDNRFIFDKLRLREWGIDEARAEAPERFAELAVLDLCSGDGKLWSAMQERRPIARYLPCDKAPRLPGALKGDAVRLIQALPIARFNVIDIDTYGSPWEEFLTLLLRIEAPTLVFLTHGSVSAGQGIGVPRATLRAMGIPDKWNVPKSTDLLRYAALYTLRSAANYTIIGPVGRIRHPHVTYYSVLLKPLEG